MEQYIDVDKIKKALNLLISLDNPHYRNMSIVENYEDFVLDNDLEGYFMINPEDEILREDFEQSSSRHEQDIENEDECDIENEDDIDDEDNVDPMRKWKFDFSDKITFVNDYPEIDIVEDVEPPNPDEPVIVAPGEGKKPENILRSRHWDVRAFPQLHPDSLNGLHEQREVKLTDIEYFQQRLLNVDRRFCNNSEYLFAAHGYLEMKRMESNINISYMRGKKNAKGEYSLEDAFSVMENMPGTPRYWAKKKMEIVGKLYNLGPFPLFYTLSCAESRWNENFTTFLQEHTIEYEYSENIEHCFVDGIPIDEFLRKEENLTKHEYIRQNILNVTLNFDKRVKEHLKTIILNKYSRLPITKYSYRIEFQLRFVSFIHRFLKAQLSTD